MLKSNKCRKRMSIKNAIFPTDREKAMLKNVLSNKATKI